VARVRTVLFRAAVIGLALFTVLADVSSLFVYLPRWLIGVVALLVLLPASTRSKRWHRGAAVALLVALPYALAPVRWNFLKSFYADCESLHPGMTMAEARAVMAPYGGDLPAWFAGARMAGVAESAEERSARVLVIPSPAYSADWCVLYPSGDRLARVVISPD